MKDYILIFDFGHGTRKYTINKHAPDGSLYEGEWNREVGMRLVKDLELMGFDCRMIVPEDEDVPLQDRCDRANKIIKENPDKHCLFISIHVNANFDDGKNWGKQNGWTVWVYRKASQNSRKLAKLFYETAKELGLKGNQVAPAMGYWEAGFKVLRSTNCPAILTENMFFDNKKDNEWLRSEEGKETIVNLHIVGICKYLGLPYAICKG